MKLKKVMLIARLIYSSLILIETSMIISGLSNVIPGTIAASILLILWIINERKYYNYRKRWGKYDIDR